MAIVTTYTWMITLLEQHFTFPPFFNLHHHSTSPSATMTTCAYNSYNLTFSPFIFIQELPFLARTHPEEPTLHSTHSPFFIFGSSSGLAHVCTQYILMDHRIAQKNLSSSKHIKLTFLLLSLLLFLLLCYYDTIIIGLHTRLYTALHTPTTQQQKQILNWYGKAFATFAIP